MTSSTRLLVVEDEPDLLDLYRDVLDQIVIHAPEGGDLRIEVTATSTGQAALRAVEEAVSSERPFCGGFFDLMLSGNLDGIETIARVVRVDPRMACTVISGAGSEILDRLVPIFRGREEDWGFAAKPVSIHELHRHGVQMVMEWNRRRRLEYLQSHLEQEVRERTRQLEEAHQRLLQSEKLAGIGVLAAGIGHEINNPVAFVQSNLDTLHMYATRLLGLLDSLGEIEKAPAEPRDLQGARMRIQQAGRAARIDVIRKDLVPLVEDSRDGMRRIREIVSALKTMSRMSETEPVPTDLNACLESALLICRNTIKHKAEVVRDLSELPPVLCRPGEIHQVIANLLVNAAQAIPERGTITVSTEVRGGMAVVEVRDTGCGISPELLSKIFEPFFTTKPTGTGTGLGLALSNDIVRSHGGSLEAESAAGSGSTFRVLLPLEASAGAAR